MAVPKETVWDLDPHSRAKHEILRRYLGAWFPILSTYKGRILYIDGFCGPGRYKNGEPGSPIIALEVAKNHRKTLQGELQFWFIDERPDRIEHLKSELASLELPSSFKTSTEVGCFHEKISPLLTQTEIGKKPLPPTFVFIDPFGFSGIPFKLIFQLLKQPSCEIFITFMVDAINRWLEHPKPEITQHIEDVFGTDEAVTIAKGTGNRVASLRVLYQKQLQRVARFVRYFEMRDSDDRIQYYLFFASNNPLGHLKMKEAMWTVSPGGEFRFSDATNPNQLILLEADPTAALIDILSNQFERQRVTGEEIRRFVEDATPFLGKHKTIALGQLEMAQKIRVEPKKLDGSVRRTNTYPDNVVINFLQ